MERRSGFKSLVVFLICVAAIYFVAFKFFIADDILMRQVQKNAKLIFNRDIEAINMSLSPMGDFKARNISISSRGGFQNGKMGAIESISTKVLFLSFFNRKLVLRNLNIDGFDINFGGKSFKSVKLSKIESLFRQMLDRNSWGRLMENGVEIRGISISNGNALLKTKSQNIRFRNIFIKSSGFDEDALFDGDISFDIDGANVKTKTHVNADFIYNKRDRSLQFKNLTASSLSLRGDIKINFSANEPSVEYNMRISKSDESKLGNFLDKTFLSTLNKRTTAKEIIFLSR